MNESLRSAGRSGLRLSGGRRDVEALGIGGDVRGRPVLVVDDTISAGGTLVAAVNAARPASATRRLSLTEGEVE